MEAGAPLISWHGRDSLQMRVPSQSLGPGRAPGFSFGGGGHASSVGLHGARDISA